MKRRQALGWSEGQNIAFSRHKAQRSWMRR